MPGPVRRVAVTVRSSTDYNTSTATTDGSDQTTPVDAIGLILVIDQSAVAASSAGGGTGSMTHTIQLKDPVSANYSGSTGAVTTTTGLGTWFLSCYPGMGSVAPTSGAAGKADLILPDIWRIQSSASSSATNFTYSVGAIYIPTKTI